jgi:glycosyltransferase involved in cell wall biosynthesis
MNQMPKSTQPFISPEGSTVAVIPAFNERSTIRDVAACALTHVSTVVVVDDGSIDGTAAELEGLPVVLLRNEQNQGKGHALWKGMQHARSLRATGIITLDADGQHSPDDIPRLIAAAQEHPADIIVGARLLARENQPWPRRWANRIADFWIGCAAGQHLADSQSGFRLYPARLFDALDITPDRARGFVFESELLIAATRRGAVIRAVAIAATPPHGARPSHFRPVRDIALISRMIAWKLACRWFFPAWLHRGLIRARPAARSAMPPA